MGTTYKKIRSERFAERFRKGISVFQIVQPPKAVSVVLYVKARLLKSSLRSKKLQLKMNA